jgi:hypothetical protein
MDSLSKGMAWMGLVLCAGLVWAGWMVMQGGVTERKPGVEGVAGPARPSAELEPLITPIGGDSAVRLSNRKPLATPENKTAQNLSYSGPEVEVWVFNEQGDAVEGALVSPATTGLEGDYVKSDAAGRCWVFTSLAEHGPVTWIRAGKDGQGWGQAQYKPGERVQIVLSKEVARNISDKTPWMGEQWEVIVKSFNGGPVEGAVVRSGNASVRGGNPVLTGSDGRCHVKKQTGQVGVNDTVVAFKEGLGDGQAQLEGQGPIEVVLGVASVQRNPQSPASQTPTGSTNAKTK